MKVNIVSVGNSKGIRIPKTLLKQLGFQEQADMEIGKDGLVIKPVKGKPREGWSSAFKLMHERKEDLLSIDEKTDFEAEGWEWK
ncbi:MAG: peptidase [Deltaproteobacteria bacterium RIFCSPLOWO2_02_FULL_53_8]|nr:MAG: peptidase [Deltaproteobacteria bacterium RIFCSPLOWO2_02_FULL_53_8]